MEDQRRLSLSARRGSRLSFRQRFFSVSSTTSSSSDLDSEIHDKESHHFSSGSSSPRAKAPPSPIRVQEIRTSPPVTPYVPRHAASDFARMPISAPSSPRLPEIPEQQGSRTEAAWRAEFAGFQSMVDNAPEGDNRRLSVFEQKKLRRHTVYPAGNLGQMEDEVSRGRRAGGEDRRRSSIAQMFQDYVKPGAPGR